MESKKVVHVHLIDQEFNGKTDFYFGSIAAIYDTLPEYIIGMKKNSLMQYLWHRNGKYESNRVQVTVDEIHRKKNSRSSLNES